jgi:hypothetical protein
MVGIRVCRNEKRDHDGNDMNAMTRMQHLEGETADG